jgi:PncC family amidohydrolase
MEDLVKELAIELLNNNLTIGTAESCTAGLISAAIASRSGASKYHRGGFITYATDLKEKLLDVGHNTIVDHDVVSSQVAMQMALGGLYKLECNICIAITGYAGETGGNEKVPRGTVWICIGRLGGPSINFRYKKLELHGTRGENIETCVREALTLAIKTIRNEE